MSLPDGPPRRPASDSFGETDFTAFQRRMEARSGVRLGEYKADQMCRRIAALAQKSGCASFAAYAALVERDSARLAEFHDRMTINVTELLRNPDRFAELTASILPDLLTLRMGAPLSAGAPDAPTARRLIPWRCCCMRSARRSRTRSKGPTLISPSSPKQTAPALASRTWSTFPPPAGRRIFTT